MSGGVAAGGGVAAAGGAAGGGAAGGGAAGGGAAGGGAAGGGAAGGAAAGGAARDPGLQPERTALSWRRTIMSAVVADLLIWRGWLQALSNAPVPAADGGSSAIGEGLVEAGYSAQVTGLGVCAVVACLTTIALVICAVSRIRTLHAGVAALESSDAIAVPALMVRTVSAAIVALALAAMGALALGMRV